MSQEIQPKTQDVEQAEGDLVETNAITSQGTKDIELMDEDHPQVQAIGKQAIKTQTQNGLGEFLSDSIYESDAAFVREYFQNSETACIRAAKYLLRNHPDYGEEWLTQKLWVDKETGETVRRYTEADAEQARLPDGDNLPANPEDLNTDNHEDLRVIEVPRSLTEVLDAARELGYDPTIEVTVYHGERKIVWEDNGIGMTLYEFEEAFMNNFSSGSAQDEDTGGKFGVGAKSSALAHGKRGSMEGYTKTRRDDVPDYSKEGVSFYAYLEGANLQPNDDIPDDFRGTRFEIPVIDDFNLGQMQEWVEKFTEMLRVPVLYHEYDNGSERVNEEYEATDFVEYHDDPPVVMERPGEFSVVSGPNTGGYNQPDTWLVSMPIKRNTPKSIRSFWTAHIQVHDEQGRIVAGPNRGRYVDGSTVYETRAKEQEVGDLDDNDVPLPQPTGSRDNLKRDSGKSFFSWLSSKVKSAELARVAETAEAMQEADHPADVIADGDGDDWKLFKKMVDYHGPYRVLRSERKFGKFISDRDEFPDYDDETLTQVYRLFTDVEHAKKNSLRPNKKTGRTERPLGDILANADRDKTFMGVTINEHRHAVVYNTYPDGGVVISIDGANSYKSYRENFGFTKLTEVPRTQSDDHDFDVPDNIHEKNQRTSSGSNEGKPDAMDERTLKIRCDNTNQQIDKRYTIEKTLERLDQGTIGGKSTLVVFPRGGEESISDHYGMQKFAAIVSASQEELDALHDHEQVLTYEEFKTRSEETVIATDQGGIKAGDLRQDDRLVVLVYATSKETKLLLADDPEKQRLRELLANDVANSTYAWPPNDTDEDDCEVLFAAADILTLQRAEFALYKSYTGTNGVIQGLRLGHKRFRGNANIDWGTLSVSFSDYERKAKTPEWDDDSEVYRWFGKSDYLDAMLFGWHDAGEDPTDYDTESVRNLTGKGIVKASIYQEADDGQ